MKTLINSIINFWYLIRFYFLLWFTKIFESEPVNPRNKKGYKIIFEDDFDFRIDWGNQWNDYYSKHSETEADRIKHSIDRIEANNGLKLYTKQITDPYWIVESGYLNTKGKRHFESETYFEIRCLMPPEGKKFFPAFWIYGVNSCPPDEIDIFEGMSTKDIGGETRHFTMTNHFEGKRKTMQGRRLGGLKLSQKYHTFGMLWEKDKITWYLNNIPVYRLVKNVPQKEMCLVINIYGFKECTYKKNEKAVLRANYVRAYKKL